MRLRPKPWSREWIESHSDLVINNLTAQEHMGKWHQVFKNDNSINLEIGTGKGQWILAMAQKFPDQNFLGLEIQETAIAIAARKSFELVGKLPNLLYILGDGAGVETYFQKGEISKIYLNHSDPWPKARHEKRRLTSESFLNSYKQVLPDRGIVEFKTDNRNLFDYSLESMRSFGMKIDENNLSFDLHNEIFKHPDNVETEYEQKWSAKGSPEHWVRAEMTN